MKNYIVKAIITFDDYEGKEVKAENPKIKRNVNDVFEVTKERYEYLKSKNAVTLMGIKEVKEELKEVINSKSNIEKKEEICYNKPIKKGRKKKEV